MSHIRTRFAPSPTGLLHVGGLRTALYNYLFAKKNGGSFILRIEDTDQHRLVPESVPNYLFNLAWAGIEFDEGPGKAGNYGPYVQSQRLDIYKKYAQVLIEKDLAYYCFCSSERLEKIRQELVAQKLSPAYDKLCRNLSKDDVTARLAQGTPHVIRMKIPLEDEITFEDQIRGSISIAYKAIDDQVLIKSDGFPTYHLAVVVDDHCMAISHVIRGEEWLPSTPKHLLLYRYFGWQAPIFAHLPLLLNPDKSKLSKRQGDVSVDDYRNKGYLPEALVNFVAFLGWNPGDTRELFTMEELIQEFSLQRVGKSGAIFNVEKLQWFNQQYIHAMSDDKLLALIKPELLEKKWPDATDNYVKKVITLLKERVAVLPDFLSEGYYFFIEPTSYDEKGKAKAWSPETPEHLQALAKSFSELTTFDATSAEQALRKYAEKIQINANKLISELRLALSGVTYGPGLFHMIEVLGKEKALHRIEQALKTLQ